MKQASSVILPNTLGAAALGAAIVLALSPSSAEEPTTRIIVQSSQKCLDVRGGPQQKSDGALIEQWACTGATNQSWTLRDIGGGQYELVASSSGKCAEVIGGAVVKKAGIQQATCNGTPRQLWSLRSKGSGIYEIINVPSNLCLDVTGGPQQLDDGALTELYDCTGATNQAWALTLPPPPTPRPLVAKHSGKCLDVNGGPQAKQDGAPIDQWSCSGASNQNWIVQDVGAGLVELIAQSSGKCVSPVNSGTANGTPLEQRDCSAAATQLWIMQPTGNVGEYRFVNAASNRCLDVNGGPQNQVDGAFADLWDCTGAANQTWSNSRVLTGTRDPLKWPFAASSIWNMPIGSGAVYVPANLSGWPGKAANAPGWDTANMPRVDHERIILAPNAPRTAIQYESTAFTGNAQDRCIVDPGGHSGFPLYAPIPTSYLVTGSTHNDGAAILLSDAHTILQTQPFARCTAGAAATSFAVFPNVDLFGDGRTGAHGGSKLSSIGGSIRVGELRPGGQGPRHAIKFNVYAKEAFYDCSKNTVTDKELCTSTDAAVTSTSDCCNRWPADVADSGATTNYGSDNHNSNKAMKMGALLAIPPSVNLATLGLETEPGRQLAWTLQNYGAYIVDSTGGPGFAISAEDGPPDAARCANLPNGCSKLDEFKADYGYSMEEGRVSDLTSTNPDAMKRAPWVRDMQRLLQALYVVNNNSPTSIDGGGDPLQPLAPPFQ